MINNINHNNENHHFLSTSPTTPSGRNCNVPTQLADKLFSAIDANGDGAVDKAELSDAVRNHGKKSASADDMFSKLDANNDGQISKDEMTNGIKSVMNGYGHLFRAGKGAHHPDSEGWKPEVGSSIDPADSWNPEFGSSVDPADSWKLEVGSSVDPGLNS